MITHGLGFRVWGECLETQAARNMDISTTTKGYVGTRSSNGVISTWRARGLVSRLIIPITHVATLDILVINLLTTSHDPPSTVLGRM